MSYMGVCRCSWRVDILSAKVIHNTHFVVVAFDVQGSGMSTGLPDWWIYWAPLWISRRLPLLCVFLVSWVILFHKFLVNLTYMILTSIEAPNLCLFLVRGTSRQQREEWILGLPLQQNVWRRVKCSGVVTEVLSTSVPFQSLKVRQIKPKLSVPR